MFPVFEGELSTEVSEANALRMKRSGFSGIRTARDMPPLDLEAFDTLAFRLRGDGRSYISNVRLLSQEKVVRFSQPSFVVALPGCGSLTRCLGLTEMQCSGLCMPPQKRMSRMEIESDLNWLNYVKIATNALSWATKLEDYRP